MTRLKQQISTDTISNKKRWLYYCRNRHFGDLLLSIIIFFLKIVSADICCFNINW